MTVNPKLISFLIASRNDSYMGESLYRLETTINSIAGSFYRMGRIAEVEIMVCDWGSEVPLCREKELNLIASAKEITKFITVPKYFADKHSGDSPFPEVLMRNVAIRRCSGEFLIATNGDIFFTDQFTASLFSMVSNLKKGFRLKLTLDYLSKIAKSNRDGRHAAFVRFAIAVWRKRSFLFYCSRQHIPYDFVCTKPSCQELLSYLQSASGQALIKYDPIPSNLMGAIGDFILLDRSAWLNMRGYDEKLIYWGWMDIDVCKRASMFHEPVDLSLFGENLFHLEHYKSRSKSNRKVNEGITHEFVKNTENDDWGFFEQKFEVSSCQS